jgi:hypothetical protein
MNEINEEQVRKEHHQQYEHDWAHQEDLGVKIDMQLKSQMICRQGSRLFSDVGGAKSCSQTQLKVSYGKGRIICIEGSI